MLSRTISLEEQGELRRGSAEKAARKFYQTCTSYLERWRNPFEEISTLSWASLEPAPLWDNVQRSEQLITSEFSHVHLEEDSLFDEACNVSRHVTIEKLEEWESQRKPVRERWVDVLQHGIDKIKKSVCVNHIQCHTPRVIAGSFLI